MSAQTAPLKTEEAAAEAERIACLNSLQVCGTDPDERLDALTCAAAEHFDVSIALITLIDVSQQWIKSNHGLPVRSTARSIAFCHYTIQRQRLLIVENTLEDARFARNPLVTNAPHIRFYAGAPLLIGNRYRIGSFCLLHDIPRGFDLASRRKLWRFSQVASQLIERLYGNGRESIPA
ncbi:GAF domain-containing protein [Hyphomonas sp.]|uniref:GAF domain-containing protein n=1 Tax=Hyphomonas sp. TaxID=87 RepID=UPI003919C348